jgi:hypothetical protein
MTGALTVTQGVHDLAKTVGEAIADVELDIARRDAALRQYLAAYKLDAAVSAASGAANVVGKSLVAAAVTDPRLICGMDNNTGKLIRGIEYLRQRLYDAIFTRKHSQVLCRQRGSGLLDNIDSPMSAVTVPLWIADIVDAVNDDFSGVPDFKLTRVKVADASVAGKLQLLLVGKWLNSNVELAL